MTVPRSAGGAARYGANLAASDVRIALAVTIGIFCCGTHAYALCGKAKPPASTAIAGWSWMICRQALRPWSAPMGLTL